MNLSAIKQILAQDGIQLTKSLGQCFLHDGNQLRRIVEAAELKKNDRVLEIGPGLGPLTELLLQRAGSVLGIEKDARLVAVLRRRFGLEPEPAVRPSTGATLLPESAPPAAAPPRNGEMRTLGQGLTLVHGDAVVFLKSQPRDWSGWKLVANLPFSVASPILVELALANSGPERLVTTLQLEVARRLMASSGAKDYGVLTLLVGLDYELRSWFKIPAGCFFPQPEVDSACVCLVRRSQPLLPPHQKATFIRLVKRGFSQRRKTMQKLLKTDWPQDRLARAFAELGDAQLPANARAEAASLEHFVRLTQHLDRDLPHA